jgi:hypothetical protein
MLIWFELAGLRQTDGMPFFIRRKFSTKLSSHRNATLLPFLTAWRGGPFSPGELLNFRIVSVVGQPCILTLAKTVPDMAGNSWTNIVGIEPSPDPVQVSGLYARRQPKARQPYQAVNQYGGQPGQQCVQQPPQGYPQPAPGYQVPPPQQQYAQQPVQQAYQPAPQQFAPSQVQALAQPQNRQSAPAPQQTPAMPAHTTETLSPITGPTAHTLDNSKFPF